MLQLQPYIKPWKDRGLEVVLVTSDRPADIERFLSGNPMEVTILLDSMGKAGNIYRVNGIPASFLADRQGVLRYSSVGWGSGSLKNLQAEIDEIMK